MNRTAVVSSNLSEVGYDPTSSTLEIAFVKGGVYQYFGVPGSVYDGLMSAASKGRYFDMHIKKARYAVTRISA